MNQTDQIKKRFPEVIDDDLVKASAMQKRLEAIDMEVKEYCSSTEDQKKLYWHLIDRGFTNDEIWIYSPNIGGDVGADEPDWV